MKIWGKINENLGEMGKIRGKIRGKVNENWGKVTENWGKSY